MNEQAPLFPREGARSPVCAQHLILTWRRTEEHTNTTEYYIDVPELLGEARGVRIREGGSQPAALSQSFRNPGPANIKPANTPVDSCPLSLLTTADHDPDLAAFCASLQNSADPTFPSILGHFHSITASRASRLFTSLPHSPRTPDGALSSSPAAPHSLFVRLSCQGPRTQLPGDKLHLEAPPPKPRRRHAASRPPFFVPAAKTRINKPREVALLFDRDGDRDGDGDDGAGVHSVWLLHLRPAPPQSCGF